MALRPLIRLQIVYHQARLRLIHWRLAILEKRREYADSGLSGLMITAIGSSTVSWAILEWHLDNLIDTLHANGGSSVQSTLPVSLDGKLEYLKDAVRNQVVPSQHAQEMTELRAIFQDLKVKRHDTVHGIVIYQPRAGHWIATRTWVKKGTRLSKATKYRLEDVHQLSISARDLAHRVKAAHNLIRSDFGLEDFQYPGD